MRDQPRRGRQEAGCGFAPLNQTFYETPVTPPSEADASILIEDYLHRVASRAPEGKSQVLTADLGKSRLPEAIR